MSTLSSCRRALGPSVVGALVTLGCAEDRTGPPTLQEDSPSLSAASTPGIIVTTTSDAADFGGAQQVSDLPGPDGKVSLREAITAADNTAGPQTIGFSIPTGDAGFNGTVFTMRPASALPGLTDDGTTIDGSTQTDFTGNTNASGPEIVLDGSLAADAFTGLSISPSSDGNVIHGLVVNRFVNGSGIHIEGSDNRISGCYLGTDETGTQARPNGGTGIQIESDAGLGTPDDNRIVGNLVSGNTAGGIHVSNGHGNLIQANLIGTNRTGMVALGNGPDADGIDLFSEGPLPGTRVLHNLISGNTRSGIIAFAADNNVIQGNLIGTNIRGAPVLGNGEYGVSISSGPSGTAATGNRVGGMSTQGNLIAGNSTGVVVESDGAHVGNRILGNRIFSNVTIGIDLLNNGVTANDPGDADVGPNNLQNFPVLSSAVIQGGQLRVAGTIDTPNPATVTIEFFANPVPTPGGDPSGHGEGAIFLGSVRPNGSGSFNARLPRVPRGTLVSATATDAAGNTSEFAANIAVQ